MDFNHRQHNYLDPPLPDAPGCRHTSPNMPNSGCQHTGPDMSNTDFLYTGPDMHNPTTPAAIRERDLQLKGIGDETVKYGRWKRKVALHNLAKNSYQSDKPEEDGDWWKLSGTRPNIPNAPTCSLPIIVVRLMAYIPICIPKNNTWTYPFKVIEEEGFLVKEQLAVWIRKWMKLTHAEAGNFSHLLIATPRTRYTASDFENYMPIQVKENYDQFIHEFITEQGAHQRLLLITHLWNRPVQPRTDSLPLQGDTWTGAR